jgi:hypothetical protein
MSSFSDFDKWHILGYLNHFPVAGGAYKPAKFGGRQAASTKSFGKVIKLLWRLPDIFSNACSLW